MVKLNAVTVRVEDLGCIVNAGMKLGRNHLGDFDIMVAEKCHGIAKLAVVSDLQAERGTWSGSQDRARPGAPAARAPASDAPCCNEGKGSGGL